MIHAIPSVQPTTATGYLPGAGALTDTPTANATGFQSQLAGAVDDLRQMQSTSRSLSVKAITGDLSDIHNATIAATRAQVTLELVAAVRNKGVDAFTEIMRMQA